MKKKSFILGLLLGAILAGVALFAVYYALRGEGDWLEYVENTLLPNVVTAMSTVFVVYFGVRPTLKSVTSCAASFFSAEKSVALAAQRNAKTDEKIAESERKFTEQSAATEAKLEAFEKELCSVKESSSQIKEMLKLGFGNMDELVKKGTSKNICKVDRQDEEK